MLTVVPATSKQGLGASIEARLRSDLAAVESALDHALSTASALTQSIIASRRDLGVPVHTGQAALMRLQRIQDRLVDASTDSFRVHRELAEIGKSLMICDDPTDFQKGSLIENDPLVAAA